jgi:uncharacterized protein (DUF433 family)
MTVIERITSSPDVMCGKPVIRGTRITVELLLRKLSEGASEADLLQSYPSLQIEDIKAIMAYAAEAVADRGASPPDEPEKKQSGASTSKTRA